MYMMREFGHGVFVPERSTAGMRAERVSVSLTRQACFAAEVNHKCNTVKPVLSDHPFR